MFAKDTVDETMTVDLNIGRRDGKKTKFDNLVDEKLENVGQGEFKGELASCEHGQYHKDHQRRDKGF